ncbi:MAG: hypothetical protein WD063_02065, partial [Pirellulales bacterium]
AIAAAEDSTLGPMVVDKKIYKVMLMAPYSAKQDAHLWARLSYPSDASNGFLKEFRAIMTAFETEPPPDEPQAPRENAPR